MAFGQFDGNHLRIEAKTSSEGNVILDALQNDFSFPIALFRHIISGLEKNSMLSQLFFELLTRPNIELAFNAFRIGVQR